MAELFNYNPDGDEEKKEEKIEEKMEEKKEEKESTLFGLGESLLLPIVLILMLDKNHSNSPILNNLKKITKDFINLPLNVDFSTQDIETMQNAINTVSPYVNPDNSFVVDKFSSFLSALSQINTLKEFRNDMARNSSDGSDKPLQFNNQRQKALHMLGALEQYMDEPTKKNMQNVKRTLEIIDKFHNTTNVLSEKRKSGGNVDIKDMIQLIGPLVGSANFPNAQKIDSMIRMFQLMSALDEDGGNPAAGGYDEEDDDGGIFEFIIDRYDDEEDE